MPDEIVDRFCVLGTRRGPPRASCASCATLGVDQFNIYLMHDAPDETLDAYGERDDPGVRRRAALPRADGHREAHLGAAPSIARPRRLTISSSIASSAISDRGDLDDGVAAAVAAGDELLARAGGAGMHLAHEAQLVVAGRAASRPRRPRPPRPRRTRRRARRRPPGSRAAPASARSRIGVSRRTLSSTSSRSKISSDFRAIAAETGWPPNVRPCISVQPGSHRARPRSARRAAPRPSARGRR